ncbi:MAG: EamA family transporter [Actinobacteria bacterium]|uniref:Unannotated protein n=1 Tax=freshwater metagenome TaxID=449393 RepID=A0A6J6QKQ2_9ZZZZ|nr:EamA family transporter [Actinomycetota bacterium]
MSRRYALMLLLLSAIWGASFLFIKVADRELEPMAIAWLRLALATVVLIPVSAVVIGPARLVAGVRGAWLRLAVMGLVNSAFPFALLAWAEQKLDSGLTAIFQAAAPLFSIALTVMVGQELVTRRRALGIFGGFLGVALLVGVHVHGSLWSALAVVFSGLLYAGAGVYGQRWMKDVEPLVLATGSMCTAAVLIAPFGLVALPSAMPGWKITASMATLGIIGTGFAYILYFAILRGVGASRAILVTYLVPAFAVSYGVLVLDEHVRASAIAGLALIFGGVAIGSRRSPVRPAKSP